MVDVHIAAAHEAEQAGRILAAGFSEDPVLQWLFREPRRTAKLEVFAVTEQIDLPDGPSLTTMWRISHGG